MSEASQAAKRDKYAGKLMRKLPEGWKVERVGPLWRVWDSTGMVVALTPYLGTSLSIAYKSLGKPKILLENVEMNWQEPKGLFRKKGHHSLSLVRRVKNWTARRFE